MVFLDCFECHKMRNGPLWCLFWYWVRVPELFWCEYPKLRRLSSSACLALSWCSRCYERAEWFVLACTVFVIGSRNAVLVVKNAAGRDTARFLESSTCTKKVG